MGEYSFVQEFDIYARVPGPLWYEARWERGGGDDDTLAYDDTDSYEYSFFGGASVGVRTGDSPLGTYLYDSGWSTHTAVVTPCESGSQP